MLHQLSSDPITHQVHAALVAVTTLNNTALATALSTQYPEGLCFASSTADDPTPIETLIKAVNKVPTARYLILAGEDDEQQYGATLLALAYNGVDHNVAVIVENGKRVALQNITRAEVKAFRKQVLLIDMLGCSKPKPILRHISALVAASRATFKFDEDVTEENYVVPIVSAIEPDYIAMDKAGYFIIVPQPEHQQIVVQHYAYDNRLLHTLEGSTARNLYWTILEKGWVTMLSHAAYLGRELMRAELSMEYGFPFVQQPA